MTAAAVDELDRARAEFEAAFEGVTDAALAYRRPAEEYSLGGILPHVELVLLRYAGLLEEMAAGAWGPLDCAEPAEAPRLERESRTAPAGRAHAFAALNAAHARFRAAVVGVAAADWDREAPVLYKGGLDPYPTSAAMLAAWVTDHYAEHVPQVRELAAEAAS